MTPVVGNNTHCRVVESVHCSERVETNSDWPAFGFAIHGGGDGMATRCGVSCALHDADLLGLVTAFMAGVCSFSLEVGRGHPS